MATATSTTTEKPVFDQFCKAITYAARVTDASLTAAHILAWNVGPSSLVGLEAGGDRVVYHCTDDEDFAWRFRSTKPGSTVTTPEVNAIIYLDSRPVS